jgi:hypothetical protein
MISIGLVHIRWIIITIQIIRIYHALSITNRFLESWFLSLCNACVLYCRIMLVSPLAICQH